MTAIRCVWRTAALCGVLFGLLASSAAAEGTWQSLAPLPEPIEGPSVANVGNLIISAYGFNELQGDSNKTFIYNIAHDSWTEGPTAPGAPSAEGIGVAAGDSFYALGGRGVGAGSDNNRYTPATNTWTSLAPLPIPRGGLGAAVVGDSIYAIGGRQEGSAPCGTPSTGDVERYSIASNTWTSVAPLPDERSDVGAIAQGGKIYAIGGCDTSGHRSSEVDIYSPTTNTWSEGAPMPTARAAFYGIGSKGNRIYVIGGVAEGFPGNTAANEVYDIAHNSWSEETPMTHPRGEMGVASHGGRIYTVGGGDPAFGTEQPTNDVFTP